MAVNKLPCLSPAYPLFDWKTWPDSEAALVQGGSTRKFQISCWNAIVIELENAIIASGGTWNTLYTTASEAKMDKDGRLFADKFNSLTKNIDEIVPLGWQWAVNPNFRGYIERQYFRGASDDPKNPDKLYPEYIKELVRRMNLVIEIMKDEYPGMFNAVSDYVSTTAVASGCVSAQEALPVCSNWISSKCVDLAAAAKLPAPVTVDAISLFNFEAVEPTSKESLPFTVETISSIKHSRPDVIAVPKRNVRPIGVIDHILLLPIDANGVMREVKRTEPTGTVSLSKAKAGGSSALPKAAEATRTVGLTHAARLDDDLKPLQAYVMGTMAQSNINTVVSLASPSNVLASAKQVETFAAAEIATGWLPPIWVDDGLHIRQVHDDPVLNDNGELVIT